MKLIYRFIQFIGLIVPQRLRADWRQEWEAELRYRELLLNEWDHLAWNHKLDLGRRSMGALIDALLLQPQRWEDEMFQDVRFGLRMFGRHPGFTSAIVLTLALGIGATITVFTVINSVLLRPLPYQEADRLVKVMEAQPEKKSERNYLTLGDFKEWREQSRAFEQMAAIMHTSVDVTSGTEPDSVSANQVSVNLFDMLGVRAVVGRTFIPADENPNNTSVVILSHGYWTARFGADANVIGKALTLNDKVHTIIGVLPQDFRETFESIPGRAKLWLPVVWETNALERHGPGGYFALARLPHDVTLAQARAEMSGIAERLAQMYPKSNTGVTANVFPLRDEVTRTTSETLMIFMFAALFVLLIACANIAGLILTRSIERERELAVRGALGAGPGRVFRQLLTENLMVTLIGSAGGILLASWAVRIIVPLLPPGLPRADEIQPDIRSVWLALLAAAFSAMFFGLLPALQANRLKLGEVLKNAGRSASENRRQRYWRNGFVIVQIALTVVLLLGAVLLTRSLQQLYRVDPGFKTENLLTTEISLRRRKDEIPQKWNIFWDDLLRRTRGLSGVQEAAAVMPLPLSDSMFLTQVRLAKEPSGNANEDLPVGHFFVGDGYFETMGLRIISGRSLSLIDEATSETVVVVNETFEKNYFPNQSAVGQTITVDSRQKSAQLATIVGVVSDARIRLTEPVQPQIFKSIRQFPSPSMYLVARTLNTPQSFAANIRSLVYELNKNQPLGITRTMDEVWAEYTIAPRFYLLLLGGFALLALVLASTGIYGVLNYTITQRTHEIGIRMALGAQRGDVLKIVLRQGLGLVFCGILLGLIAAAYLTKLMTALLFEVGANDPPTFVLVTLVLIIVASIACYLPARRATKVDPLIALQHE